MNVLGVEFDAKKLNYVLLVGDGAEFDVAQSNRLEITETRTKESLRAFQAAVTTLLNVTRPDVIAIKDKPESGQMDGSKNLWFRMVVCDSVPRLLRG